MTIYDITKENSLFLTRNELENKFNIPVRNMEYMGLIDAIPKQWKQILKESLDVQPILTEPTITLNNKEVDLRRLKCNDIYWLFVDQIHERPTSEAKWAEYPNIAIDQEQWSRI